MSETVIVEIPLWNGQKGHIDASDFSLVIPAASYIDENSDLFKDVDNKCLVTLKSGEQVGVSSSAKDFVSFITKAMSERYE